MACQNKTVCLQHLPNYSAQQLVQANCNGQSMVAWKGKECKGMHVSHANLSTAEAKMHLFSCSCTETSTTGRSSFVLSLGTRRDRSKRQGTTLHDIIPNSWFYTRGQISNAGCNPIKWLIPTADR